MSHNPCYRKHRSSCQAGQTALYALSAEIAEHVWHPRRPSIFTPAPLQTGKYLSLKTDGYLSVSPSKSLHHPVGLLQVQLAVAPESLTRRKAGLLRVHSFLFRAVVKLKSQIRAQRGA